MDLNAWEAFRFSSGAARDLCGARRHNQPAHALGGVCLRARRAAPRARGPPRAPGSRYGVRPRALPTQIISYSLGNITVIANFISKAINTFFS